MCISLLGILDSNNFRFVPFGELYVEEDYLAIGPLGHNFIEGGMLLNRPKIVRSILPHVAKPQTHQLISTRW